MGNALRAVRRLLPASLTAAVFLLISWSGNADNGLTMDIRRDAVDLDGPWQRLAGHEDASAWEWETAGNLGDWETTEVPGLLIGDVSSKGQEGIPCVWARRGFALDRRQASRQSVLKWNDIRFGSTIWINGQQVSAYPLTGPGASLLPPSLLREGVNHIVVRVGGWASVPRGKSGFPLIPAGASNTQSWGSKAALIGDGIWIEFYDRAYMESLLAIPRLKDGKVTIRAWFDAVGELPGTMELRAALIPPEKAGAKTSTSTFSAAQAEKGTPLDFDLPVESPLPWTPQTPDLYTVRMELLADGESCDVAEFRFGMREIAVEEGRYRLNGKPLWLRGSNLLGEWNWRGSQAADPKRYLVDEARLMNLNCFRTHAGPPNTAWSDIADEQGILFLAEMPVLFNTFDFKFTPEEWEIWHANVLQTVDGWVRKLWNHPSVIVWGLSNESGHTGWETGEYYRHVRELDPTRPAMRAGGGGGTSDTLDIHTCSNIRRGADGWVIARVIAQAAKRDPKRTLGNSEYMNSGAPRQSLRWFGEDGRREEAQVLYAQLGAEHTEAMRRLGFDLMLPYMYAGWTSFGAAPGERVWRDPYPTPMAASLHSSMAPVLASLDLFDPNYVAGTEVATPMTLINELHEEVDAQIDVYVTPGDPLFLPDASVIDGAVSHETLQRTLKADSMATEPIRWKAPDAPGAYWLSAVLTRQGDRPVVSERAIRSIADPAPAQRLKGVGLVVLGADPAGLKWLADAGAEARTSLEADPARSSAVVVWNATNVSEEQRKSAPAILGYVRQGGKLVILDQPRWDWIDLLKMKITAFFPKDEGGSSHVFPCDEMDKHPLLSGVPLESLHRWNGLPGALAECYVDMAGRKDSTPILWAEEPRRIVAWSIPEGKGEILICQLQAKGRLEGTAYDPVAERILLNLLLPGARGMEAE
ncbi:MAG: hypothetical protein NTW86_09275 [Candidatus Sumerlaeota bacterium]|nr:hypothetical protein [Candidatus Sumerlaeota bacterium]